MPEIKSREETAMDKPAPAIRYAWCFDHGVMHHFDSQPPWCTANWVPFTAAAEDDALASKEAAYGTARFFDELPGSAQLEVLEIREGWDGAFHRQDATTKEA